MVYSINERFQIKFENISSEIWATFLLKSRSDELTKKCFLHFPKKFFGQNISFGENCLDKKLLAAIGP